MYGIAHSIRTRSAPTDYGEDSPQGWPRYTPLEEDAIGNTVPTAGPTVCPCRDPSRSIGPPAGWTRAATRRLTCSGVDGEPESQLADRAHCSEALNEPVAVHRQRRSGGAICRLGCNAAA